MIYSYTVPYRIDLSSRVLRQKVAARNADEAREIVRTADPRYLNTVSSPRRGKALTGEAE